MGIMTLTLLAHIALMLGKILVGFYFFFFFFWNYFHRKDAIFAMRASHIPFAPLVFGVGLCIQLITGLYIMIGIYTALSAAVLIVFAVFATFIFHRFWSMEPGPARTLNTIIFIGNLTITLAALLLVFGISIIGL